MYPSKIILNAWHNNGDRRCSVQPLRTGGFLQSVMVASSLTPGFAATVRGLGVGDASFSGYCLDAPDMMAGGAMYHDPLRVKVQPRIAHRPE